MRGVEGMCFISFDFLIVSPQARFKLCPYQKVKTALSSSANMQEATPDLEPSVVAAPSYSISHAADLGKWHVEASQHIHDDVEDHLLTCRIHFTQANKFSCTMKRPLTHRRHNTTCSTLTTSTVSLTITVKHGV